VSPEVYIRRSLMGVYLINANVTRPSSFIVDSEVLFYFTSSFLFDVNNSSHTLNNIKTSNTPSFVTIVHRQQSSLLLGKSTVVTTQIATSENRHLPLYESPINLSRKYEIPRYKRFKHISLTVSSNGNVAYG
jgi:hypothetical protein